MNMDASGSCDPHMQPASTSGICDPHMQNTDGRTDLRRSGYVARESLVGNRAQGGSNNSAPHVGENGRYEVIRTKLTEERAPIPGRVLVLRRDNYRCVFCGAGGRLEVDHIIPWSAGGSDDLDNLRTLCHACNVERSNFRVVDDSFRRLPNGHQCINCTPSLLGEDDVIPVYCIICGTKAPVRRLPRGAVQGCNHRSALLRAIRAEQPLVADHGRSSTPMTREPVVCRHCAVTAAPQSSKALTALGGTTPAVTCIGAAVTLLGICEATP